MWNSIHYANINISVSWYIVQNYIHLRNKCWFCISCIINNICFVQNSSQYDKIWSKIYIRDTVDCYFSIIAKKIFLLWIRFSFSCFLFNFNCIIFVFCIVICSLVFSFSYFSTSKNLNKMKINNFALKTSWNNIKSVHIYFNICHLLSLTKAKKYI